VKEEIEVPLPHPRSITDIALVRLKRELLTTLQADLQQSFE
jgi:hypothetical protein